jgi:hypothetical protein
VIGGPGIFLIEVHDYAAFGEGLKRKLLRELISSPRDASANQSTSSSGMDFPAACDMVARKRRQPRHFC